MLLALALMAAAVPPSVTLDVDASRIADRILHTSMTFPASSGVFTLEFPKWIPGEHAPSGPVDGVTGLHFWVNGVEAKWRRDPIEMFAFHVDVPAAHSLVQVAFDFTAPSEGDKFSGKAIASAQVGVLCWSHVVLVPAHTKSDDVQYEATLTLPSGWQAGTALPIQATVADKIKFAPATLTTLIDSPVNMGRFFKRVVLDATHSVDIAADSAAALEIKPEIVTQWKQLVAEAGALFGHRHYRRYEFLVTMSDHLGDFGLEHHESSDNRFGERGLIDDDARLLISSLLPHEYAHSWNGKYRRPQGLATPDYSSAMSGEMLWAYEGLTEYLGFVLAARSGLQTQEEWAGEFGYWFAMMEKRGGRTWSPLQDTATFAQRLYDAPSQWADSRRSTDFYSEGALLWLDVDVRIRTLTKGKKSLDDFCRRFHGGSAGGKPEVIAYSFEELMGALNDIAPFPWAEFWRSHLDETRTRPLQGLLSSGWTLAFKPEPSAYAAAFAADNQTFDERFSLGLELSEEDHSVIDVVVDGPAWRAGFVPGMTVLGLDGRKITKEVLLDAVRMSGTRTTPIEFLVDNADFFRTLSVDYHDGARFPVLQRVKGRPDILSRILKPKTAHALRPEPEQKQH